ncbi:GLPGLI family protein [Pedobacter sp. JCM 36344]|uniref:GLPGLI family protein n=1 Tax=Pedobacter sp. JCM 36344 TaxID=3374280 RepID=UPI00397B5D90
MDGPWKFRGLPGLILKAEDDQKLFFYEAVCIEKPVRPIQISSFVDERFTRCTLEQYQKKKKQPKTIQVYFNAGILHITRPPREGELLLQETE